ncbi:major facilitator superfamily domain-containing protein [Pseudomassariella vexata]|uniref:Major facilitator superfamily domain-containing protein n=1 Tax=Pseudomassariella vexata TaxID=1141098 RepID=A0A1Y2EB26_9PEZI|nr:major facilitator superfamily domain-containing protein [Pseudomassariella vexata]ORY68617.1 major facilitator superfamily domain-containing protein [Pseudomassariella vexata]
MTTAHNAPKLPSKQLAILAVARFAEPLAMTSVYPYLPEMIASFGVEKKDIAKWAGLTSAVFSLAQSITAVPWGRASDRFGRKPVIMTGLLCTMVCFLIWGCSTSLTMAIIVRAVQGASNGNVGIIRTMVAEMVPQRELQPKAFSIMPLVWSIGSIFGPAFGGFFANPATQFPDVFGNSTFLKKFPFALPNIMGSLIFLLSLTVGTLFLKETLERKRHVRDYGLVLGERLMAPFTKQNHHHHHHHHRRYSFQDDEMTAPLLAANNDHHARQSHDHEAKTDVPSSPSMKAVFTRQTVINLVSYTFLALHSVAYDQVLSVFLNYPRQHHDASNTHLPFLFSGGFGLNSGRIGTIFTLYGIICGLIQFILFPTLCSYFGVLNCFRGCAVTFPIVYVLTPCTTLIEDETLRFAALLAVLIVKAFAVIVGFPCTTILLTNSASSLSILGTLNGFATMFSALGRAAGPAMTGAAFTWGVKRGAIAVPWWILAAIASVGAIQAWQIEEQDGPSRAADSDSDSDSEMENGDEDTAPTARDDLPLLGSTKSSSRGLVDYGSMTRQSSDRR